MAIRKRTGKRGVTWQIDYTDPTGKRVRRNFKKKKDAVAELGKRVSLIAEGSYLDVKKPCETTLGQMVDIYTDKYGGQPSFEISKRGWLENFKEYFGESTLLDQITYNKICDYQSHLENKPTRQGKVRKKSSVNREISCLRHLLKMAVLRDKLTSDPFANKESLHYKEPKGQVRFLEKEEIDRLLEMTMPEHYRDAIIGILLTGMRRQEALNLKWQHVRKGLIYLEKTKTDNPRWIPISDELRDHLGAVRLKNGLKSEHVFCDPRGRKINRDSFSGAVESAMRRANIDPSRPVHVLRHTFASHYMMRTGDLRGLNEILGHKTLQMTMRYAHLAPKYLQGSINKMNGLTTKKSDEKVTSIVSKSSIPSI